MNTYKSLAFFIMLTLSLSSAVSAAEYQFQSIVDKIIPQGKDFESLDLKEGDPIEGIIELDRKDRHTGVYKGLFVWGFSVTKFSVKSPLNIAFQRGDLTVNQTLEQTALSCVKRNSGSCGVTGSPLKSISRTDSSIESYPPLEYLLTQPGLKDADIVFQKAVDLFLGNIIKGDTKVILKFANEEKPNDYIRIILNITEVENSEVISNTETTALE